MHQGNETRPLGAAGPQNPLCLAAEGSEISKPKFSAQGDSPAAAGLARICSLMAVLPLFEGMHQ